MCFMNCGRIRIRIRTLTRVGSSCSATQGLEEISARGLLSPRARLVWTVEAASHFEAVTLYYEYQGWGTYTTDQEWDRVTYAEHGWE
jgi:hypothetical protein